MSKNLLITGASSGIGKAVALEFAKRDGSKNHLILVARRRDKLETIAEAARQLGATVTIKVADLGRTQEIAKLFEEIDAKQIKLDLVFNNAGLGFVKKAWEMTDAETEAIIDVNVKGMILVAQKAAARMKEQSNGHIIFVSSVAGYTLFPNWSVYCASKWGITAYANVLRQEIAPFGVKISTVHPGPVKTEFFDKDKADVDMSKSEKTMPAILASEVANDVYNLAYTNKTRIFNPPKLVLFAEAFRLFPKMMQKMLSGLTN
jgi:short-subunit dehydrogenase